MLVNINLHNGISPQIILIMYYHTCRIIVLRISCVVVLVVLIYCLTGLVDVCRINVVLFMSYRPLRHTGTNEITNTSSYPYDLS